MATVGRWQLCKKGQKTMPIVAKMVEQIAARLRTEYDLKGCHAGFHAYWRRDRLVNHPSLWWFFNKMKRLWLASLRRRSQTARLSWERFIQFVVRFFPPIRTIHPLPCHRFDARTRGRSPVR